MHKSPVLPIYSNREYTQLEGDRISAKPRKMVKLWTGLARSQNPEPAPKHMKKTIFVAVVTALLFLAIATRTVGSTTNIPEKPTASTTVQIVTVVKEVEKKDILTYQQRAWVGALEYCESRGNPKAVNPNDLDNTPSYGILQFKPSTYTYFKMRYKLDISDDYMDPAGQIKIVEQMIIRSDVDWSTQFPGCTRKLGLPPQSTQLSTLTSIDSN